MAITVPRGRQYKLIAEIEISNVDLLTGVATKLFDLPPNAVVVDGGAQVVTQAVAGTSSVLDVGYDLPTGTDDPDAFVTVMALTGAAYSSERFSANSTAIRDFPIGCDVTATRTVTGADTTPGASRVWVEYYIKDKATEVQSQ